MRFSESGQGSRPPDPLTPRRRAKGSQAGPPGPLDESADDDDGESADDDDDESADGDDGELAALRSTGPSRCEIQRVSYVIPTSIIAPHAVMAAVKST